MSVNCLVLASAGWFVLGFLPLWPSSAMSQQSQRAACRIIGKTVAVSGLREGSGLSASRTRPGVLWAHNDSADPVIVMLSENGAVLGRVRVEGAQVDDWEDIAVGPCPQGSCIYIGDIGDNNGSRKQITVYRVPEPSDGETTTRPAEVFHATYPDGAHDAESLFVADGPDVFIITKGDPGPVALYRFPRPLSAGTPMQLERIGTLASGKVGAKDRPTAAAISPDGQWIAVRTTHYVVFYQAKEFMAGRWTEVSRTDLTPLRERRGEGLAFGPEGSIFLLGEGGLFGGSGTFGRLACDLGR